MGTTKGTGAARRRAQASIDGEAAKRGIPAGAIRVRRTGAGSARLPKTGRTKNQRLALEAARGAPIPASVQTMLNCVNGQPTGPTASVGIFRYVPPTTNALAAQWHRNEWHRKLELLRDWRPSEARAASTAKRKQRLDAVIDGIGPEHTDPPMFEEAADWLLASGRAQDLYRCLVCLRWGLSDDDRRAVCDRPQCRRATKDADAAARMKARRAGLTGSKRNEVIAEYRRRAR